MKFHGPLTPKFTEYFACFTEWKIFARKFVGRDPPSLPMHFTNVFASTLAQQSAQAV